MKEPPKDRSNTSRRTYNLPYPLRGRPITALAICGAPRDRRFRSRCSADSTRLRSARRWSSPESFAPSEPDLVEVSDKGGRSQRSASSTPVQGRDIEIRTSPQGALDGPTYHHLAHSRVHAQEARMGMRVRRCGSGRRAPWRSRAILYFRRQATTEAPLASVIRRLDHGH